MRSLLAVKTLTWRLRRADGQDLLEYALLVALIALMAFSAVTAVGSTIQNVFWSTIANNF